MNDRRIEPRVRLLAGRGKPSSLDTMQDSAWQAIQIKCGVWSRLDPDRLTVPVLQYDLTQFAFYIAKLSLADILPPDFWSRRYPSIIETLYGSRGNDNWHALSLSLLVARFYDPQLYNHIETRLMVSLAAGSGQGRLRDCSLRCLVQIGKLTQPAAFELWIKAEVERIAYGISMAEYVVLVSWAGDHVRAESFPIRAERERAKAFSQIAINGSLEDVPRWTVKEPAICADAAELLRVVGGFVEGYRIGEFARQYCSVRQPEWIVPFAYLLDSHMTDDQRKAIAQDFSPERYDPDLQGLYGKVTSVIRRSRTRSDLIELLTTADKAGDFDLLVERLSQLADIVDNVDFELLQRIRHTSRKRMMELNTGPPVALS